MKRNLLATLLVVLPFIAMAQKKNEFKITFKNGILLNTADFKVIRGDGGYSGMRNTLQQGVGLQYSRRKRNFITSAGLEVGYEKFSGWTKAPVAFDGFIKPTTKMEQKDFRATIPYAQLNVGIGYKFGLPCSPEIRIGAIFHANLDEKVLLFSQPSNYIFANGQNYHDYYSAAGFGGSANRFYGSLINYVYIGSQLPVKIKGANRISAGIQLQRSFIEGYANGSVFYSFYYHSPDEMSWEEFEGKHTSVNLMLGYQL